MFVDTVMFELADNASNAINPILLFLILEEPLLGHGTGKKRWRHALPFFGRALLCVGVAVAMAEQGKAHQVWHGHPNFPSGHTTFATAAATCLVLQRGKSWGWLAAPLALIMGASLVYGRWHTPDEVAGGLLLGTTVPYLLWRLTRRPIAR